jgi:hypothetical protein
MKTAHPDDAAAVAAANKAALEGAERHRIQQELDQALADSFPASDPVSIVTSQHEEAWDFQTRPDSQPPSDSQPFSDS